ncbi:MAG: hypothetical protein D6761_04620 [Candidatus Dadabacteria bacterium]|nr:MAG: hypothetical protein D6761_04620 [Candidatus Dadabacteria bacterium]
MKRQPTTPAILLFGVLAAVGSPRLLRAGTEHTLATASIPTDTRAAPRTWAQLRGGISAADQASPVLCLDVAPLRWISIEGCGSGNGFLYRADRREISHFRLKGALAEIPVRGTWLRPQLGLGFAELEIGSDDSGFNFRRSAARNQTAAAGPEASALLGWVGSIGRDFEWLGSFGANLAWIPGADVLAAPQRRWQPSAELSFGIGW